MEENPKNRGRKHIINKSKYNKNKPKPNLPGTKKSKSLVPNWDRYEEELISKNEFIPVGSDFSRLADAPISKGSHFQFRSESIKNEDIEQTETYSSDLFNIDLNLIGLSIATVPFHERCEIRSDHFSVSQRKLIDQTAKNNEKLYEETLKQRGIDIKSIIDDYLQYNEPSTPCETESNIKLTKEKELKKETEPCSSDLKNTDIVNRNPKKIGSQAKSACSILETESLQKWLDDVLGDY